MTQPQWADVDSYYADLFMEEDETLHATLASSEAAGLPAIAVAPNLGKLLRLLLQAMRARRVLEIGTLGGYSTLWMGKALQPEGRLVTLEAEPRHADVARANITRAGLEEIVELRLGSAVETLRWMVKAGEAPFDFIFIDADKPNYAAYFTLALKLSRPGTLILADNVVRKGAVTDAGSPDANVQGVRRMNELIAAEPRVSATAIQTVGQKGYDGFALMLVLF